MAKQQQQAIDPNLVSSIIGRLRQKEATTGKKMTQEELNAIISSALGSQVSRANQAQQLALQQRQISLQEREAKAGARAARVGGAVQIHSPRVCGRVKHVVGKLCLWVRKWGR